MDSYKVAKFCRAMADLAWAKVQASMDYQAYQRQHYGVVTAELPGVAVDSCVAWKVAQEAVISPIPYRFTMAQAGAWTY